MSVANTHVNRPTRVGVIGTGFSARQHAAALCRLPGVDLVGVAGRGLDSARLMAAEFGAPVAVGHWRELLPQVEVVHNCTPTPLHGEINAAALVAGCHVLSEKPLAMTSSEASALVELADAGALVNAVCFNYRYYSLVRQLAREVRAGRYGAVHLVHGHYLQDWLLCREDWNWRLRGSTESASVAVADIGTHWLDLLCFVTGKEIVDVLADLGTLHPVRVEQTDTGDREHVVKGEDHGVIVARLSDGTRCALVVSQVSAGHKNCLEIEIDTETASLRWCQEEPNKLWVGRRDRPSELVEREPLTAVKKPGSGVLPPGHPEGWRDALVGLCADFYRSVHGEPTPGGEPGALPTFVDGYRAVLLTEATLASSVARAWEAPTPTTKAALPAEVAP